MVWFEHVIKESNPCTTLQVFHEKLKIPLHVYLDTVSQFPNPWDEQAYQYFIQAYLLKAGDSGIVGMVREYHDDNFVHLDAAVRYPIEKNSSP